MLKVCVNEDFIILISDNLWYPNKTNGSIPKFASLSDGLIVVWLQSTSHLINTTEFQNCHLDNCTHIECDIGRLNEDEYVLIEIYARLYLNTLIDNNIFEADISSIGLAKIFALPNAPRYNPPAQLVAVCLFIFCLFDTEEEEIHKKEWSEEKI